MKLKRSKIIGFLFCLGLLCGAFAQTSTASFRIVALQGNTFAFANLDSSGNLMVSTGGTAQAVPATGYNPPVALVALGTNGQFQYAHLDVNGNLMVTGAGGGMVYPGAGIPNSTGSAWSTSYGVSGTGSVALTNSPVLVTPSLGAATATSLLASGIVDGAAPLTVTTGTSANLGATYKSGYTLNQEATAAQAVAYTLPTAAAGLQYCVGNSYNGSAPTTGVLTVNTSAAGQFIIFTDGTLSATGGNVTSGGAAADFACFFGVDATHWYFKPSSGTWTKH